jgi:hypothetical protein
MTGGLINIATYVSNDLYLTGAPQITFYKMVYRRYTNFSMESVFLDFDDNINFDHESELVPPRIGDLIHKSYLHINIPNISITKQDVGVDMGAVPLTYLDKNTVADFEKIRSVFMKIMTDIYRIIFQAVNASNVTYAGLVQDVQEYVNTGDTLVLLDQYDALLLNNRQQLIAEGDPRQAVLDSRRSNLWYILTHIDPVKLFQNATNAIDTNIYEENSDEYSQELQKIMKNSALKEINLGLAMCEEVQKYFFDEQTNFTRTATNDKSNNIKFAWVKNLGHSIIEYIDIFIGGKRIDRHLGIWINIWYQLTYKNSQQDIYNQLIGNVDQMTNFDNSEKPNYDIYVPLSFWFSKFNGLSFPLVAMQYNDIRFNVKLRKLEEVFFIERIYRALLNGSDVVLTAELIDFIQNRSENQADYTLTDIELVQDIVLADIWEAKGKRLNGHILLDYIYLESPERKRFAQSGHEYLIERIQYNDFTGIEQTNFDVQLDFVNPCKELVWVFLKDQYTKNEYGYTGCRWYDHSIMLNGTNNSNPVINARMMFNNYVRIQRQIGKYFDQFQPYIYHHVSPTAGINMYSFCLDPQQHQPTGSCNFTRLTNVRLSITLDENLFRYTDPQIYPYDLDINFKITITDPSALLGQLDIDSARKIVKNMETSGTVDLNTGTVVNSDVLKIITQARTTVRIYDLLSQGTTIEIDLDDYRNLVFRTTAKCHVFDLSINILRLIGGYGALAYSGNS